MERVRAFFCLPLPEPLLRELQGWIDDASLATGRNANAKWVSRDALHVTLRFCGEISQEQVKFLAECVNELVAENFSEPFSLSLTKLGHVRPAVEGSVGGLERRGRARPRAERASRAHLP